MLGKRFENDGVPVLKLNLLQLSIKQEVDRLVKIGEYGFESVPCVLCEDSDFKLLSQKDRYGLYMPVVICTHSPSLS